MEVEIMKIEYPITDEHIGQIVYVENGLYKGEFGELVCICEKKCWVLLQSEEKPRCLSIKNIEGLKAINCW